MLISVEALKGAMQNNAIYFKYKKLDGTEKTACGTLNKEYIESRGYTFKTKPEDVSNKKPKKEPTNLSYWDVKEDKWKSFAFRANVDGVEIF